MNLALNPFGTGRKPEKVEVVEKHSGVKFSIDDYLLVCNSKDKAITPVGLAPAQIMEVYNNLKHYDTNLLGRYMAYLVQWSYQSGYNDFELEIEKPLDSFGWIIAKKDNPLRVKIDGDMKSFLGYKSKYVEFVVDGDVGYTLGDEAVNCSFKAKRSGILCGRNARNCNFDVESTDIYCGVNARDCEFIIRKDFESSLGHGAYNCTFKMPWKLYLTHYLYNHLDGVISRWFRGVKIKCI